MSCSNATRDPYQIPGYNGFVPGHMGEVGFTFSRGTHEVMRNRGPGGGQYRPCPKGCGTLDPCADHGRDLRARLHLLQGEIDPNPCMGMDAGSKFCVPRPSVTCEPKLKRNNQHGYLSRLSVYHSGKNDSFGVTACRASNTFPCKEAAPSNRPFWREFEDLTNYDPFKEYDPECRHLRLPKLKYNHESCWDEDYYLPEDCYEDYRKHGYICPPKVCECLPLDARKKDEDVKYYRIERDPNEFILPYFADPSNRLRYFKPRYTGHVPTMKFRNGEPFAVQSKNALNGFTNLYMTSHLKSRCPVWIDPEQYCDGTDYYKLFCKPRKTYDGHFHEKPIRDRLKPIFDAKDCIPPYLNEPMPLCIQRN
ncbi:unnamed protein product [Orchesella dallaii]|uniref:Uncharacterized protein n=1 Tax=Orchesella dallaii TaxID=48710 RepID=A0ABP1QII2_9HEXA